jgi:hypothetical protein
VTRRFHRLWSTNWFHDPDAEVAKLREAYDQAVAASPPPDPEPEPATPPEASAPPGNTVAIRSSAEPDTRLNNW